MFFNNLETFGLTKGRVIAFIGLTLGTAFFEGFGIAMFLPLLEYIEKGRDLAILADSSNLWQRLIGVFNFFSIQVSLFSLAGVILSLLMLRIIFSYIQKIYAAWLLQNSMCHTRNNLFAVYLRAEFSFFDKQATGTIVNLIITETMRVGSLISSLLTLVTHGMVITGFAVVLLWLSPAITAFSVFFLGLSGFLVNYYLRHTKSLSRATTLSNKQFAFLLVEKLSAIRLIKLTASQEREIDNEIAASVSVRDNMFWLKKLNARIDLLLEPLVVTGALVIFLVAVNFFHMTLSMVGLIMLILLRILPLSKEFLRSKQTVTSCLGSLEAVQSSLHEASQVYESSGGKKIFAGLDKGIKFETVSFAYSSDGPLVLDKLNLFLPAGKMTALVGPSGAGKSTLADLIPLLRKPRRGKIYFDGVNADDFNLSSLRQAISFVSQDIDILNATVRENVKFANPSATDEEILNALELAKAKNFILGLPGGLDTILGERGLRLSGGQRQRLSLARALLQQASILILDEPTSALDSEVEQDIQETMSYLRYTKKMTIVVIAHRMSTIKMADKIIVLQDGHLAEQGTHKDLVKSEDWYAKVCELQLG